MGLESQLNAKADQVFQKEYIALFSKFGNDFAALTGTNILDGYSRSQEATAALRPLINAMQLRYCASDQGAREAFEFARNLHREKFTAAFIKKAEELAEFVENGGMQ